MIEMLYDIYNTDKSDEKLIRENMDNLEIYYDKKT